jgi:hypothetical protein
MRKMSLLSIPQKSDHARADTSSWKGDNCNGHRQNRLGSESGERAVRPARLDIVLQKDIEGDGI